MRKLLVMICAALLAASCGKQEWNNFEVLDLKTEGEFPYEVVFYYKVRIDTVTDGTPFRFAIKHGDALSARNTSSNPVEITVTIGGMSEIRTLAPDEQTEWRVWP